MLKETSEIERILNIPRRPSVIPPGVAERLSAEFRTPSGTMTLKPIQAWALDEARQAHGLLGCLGTGVGKTLLTALAPTVMESTRTVVLVPGKLKRRFIEKDHPTLSEHWRLLPLTDVLGTPGIFVASHDDISSQKMGGLLEAHNPDLVVIDEAHAFKSTVAKGDRSSRTTRLLRHWQEAEKVGKTLRLIAATGTLFTDSLADAGILCWLTLGTSSPLPLDWALISAWAQSVDPVTKFGTYRQFAPSVKKLLPVGGEVSVESLREAVQLRMSETRGIVSVKDKALGVSLYVHKRSLSLPEGMQKVMKTLRTEWRTPDGEEITDVLEFSRLARQIASGFYYKRVWLNGESKELQTEWLGAQSEYNKEIRRILSRHSRAGFDSPGLIESAILSGDYKSKTYARWAAVKDLAEPGRDTIWIDDFAAADACLWGKKVGIIFYRHKAFGAKVAELSGFPLYDDDKDTIEIEAEDGSRTIVASTGAHGTGARLHNFSNSLFTYVSSSNKTHEQNIARTHRDGQSKSVCEVWLHIYSSEASSAFSKAVEKARFVNKLQNSDQKLLIADYTF